MEAAVAVAILRVEKSEAATTIIFKKRQIKKMASSPDDDAVTLQVLLAESAARIAQTTRENAALAEQHEVAAATFSSRATAEITRLQQEQHRLDDVKKLRSAAIAEAEQERDAILAKATATEQRVSEEVAAARTAQAAAEAAHRAMVLAREKALAETLARMEDERMKREEEHLAGLAAHTAAVEAKIAGMHSEHAAAVEASKAKMAALEEDQRQRELDHRAGLSAHTAKVEATIAAMHREHAAAVEASRAEIAAESAAKEKRLSDLAATERAVQVRAAEMRARGKGVGASKVELDVSGERFIVSIKSLARYPQSTLSMDVHTHQVEGPSEGEAAGGSKAAGPLQVSIDGDPLHFLLITSYLRSPDGSLPVVSDASQLRWLEKEARYYQLDELAQLCKDAYVDFFLFSPPPLIPLFFLKKKDEDNIKVIPDTQLSPHSSSLFSCPSFFFPFFHYTFFCQGTSGWTRFR